MNDTSSLSLGFPISSTKVSFCFIYWLDNKNIKHNIRADSCYHLFLSLCAFSKDMNRKWVTLEVIWLYRLCLPAFWGHPLTFQLLVLWMVKHLFDQINHSWNTFTVSFFGPTEFLLVHVTCICVVYFSASTLWL